MKRYFIIILFIIYLIVVVKSTFLKNRFNSPYPYYSNIKNRINKVKLNLDDPVPTPYTLLWFNQTLDHFNFETNGYFNQRVLIIDQYFNEKSKNEIDQICTKPLIFFCGNEGDVTFFYENSLFITNTLAQEMNALVVFAEHRYYGESLPFGNQSYTNENFQYLSSEQALADYSKIIPSILKQYNALNCPVFTTSGSYGGDLAAWMRLKYPFIVDGALASSAPLLSYMGTGVPYDVFPVGVTNDFKETSQDGSCANKIRNAFNDLETIAKADNGFNQISTSFKLCTPINSNDDFQSFLSWVESGFSYMAMADYPYPASFLEPMMGNPVNETCNLINQLENSIDIIMSGLQIYYNYTGQMMQCFNTNIFIEDQGMLIPWSYQSCTEFVFPFTTTGIKDMFYYSPFNLTEYIENCQEEYNVTPDPNWVTSVYGGTPNFPSSNIIFSNGVLDGWHGAGINVTDYSKNIIAILIPGAAHHLDLRGSNPLDPQSITDARLLELKYLTEWSEEIGKIKSLK
ncbi:hypothetical protein ACTFIR_001904 [Dictyostelium discoideum]